MKIAVYSPTISPVIDGTSIQAKRQLDLLSKNHTVKGFSFAVNRDIEHSLPLEEVNDGILRVKPCYNNKTGKFPILDGKNIGMQIREYNPEVLHIRGWYQLPAIKDIIKTLEGSNVDIYWHTDGQHECHEHFSGKKDYLKLVSEISDSNIKFIGQTSRDLEILCDLGLDDKQYYQIPPILSGQSLSDKSWDNPRVLSLARFFNYKGHEKVYDAMQKVNPKVETLLAGASDSKDSDHVIQKLRMKGASLILNPSDRLVNELYNQSTHFVLASDRETLGIAVLEAVLLGCIPIVKANQGIGSYIPPCFIYEKDVELEEKLRYMTSPENAKMLNLKLNKTRKELNPEAILGKFDTLYEDRK